MLRLAQELFCANLVLLSLVKLIFDLFGDVGLSGLLDAASFASAAAAHLLLAHLDLLCHLLVDGQSQHHRFLARWVRASVGAMKSRSNRFPRMSPG